MSTFVQRLAERVSVEPAIEQIEAAQPCFEAMVWFAMAQRVEQLIGM
jgi:hypothetical protein